MTVSKRCILLILVHFTLSYASSKKLLQVSGSLVSILHKAKALQTHMQHIVCESVLWGTRLYCA